MDPDRPFLLINANTVRPPVAPVGLEYVAHALEAAGVPVRVLDLSFEPDWQAALARAASGDLLAVGVTVRNTDDCCYATGKSFLPWICEVTSQVRRLTDAPLVLGGVGFSTSHEEVMRLTGADFGIWGEGEQAAVLLAQALDAHGDTGQIANLLYPRGDKIWRNPRTDMDLSLVPLARRRLVDNPRYQREGAMVGIETKRGCPRRCIYCADPVAKGTMVRARPPAAVAQEFEDLLTQGVTWFHLCDSEFNIISGHAKEVCRTLIERGLGDRIRWYSYCCPLPFDQELADLMLRAGCAGINFGVDSLFNPQLDRLGREQRIQHVEKLVQLLGRSGLNYMFDLLLGGPDESQNSVKETIEQARRLEIPLVGLAVGARVYPGTALSVMVNKPWLAKGLHRRPGKYAPLYFVSPRMGSDPMGLVQEMVAGDPRFMLLTAPSVRDSYNYAGDEALARAIMAGARGAYWDILRKQRRQ